MKTRTLLPAIFTTALFLNFFTILATVQLPDLNWPGKRSDWINIKTDVTPAAVGDGITDDTPALLAAMDSLNNSDSPGKRKTLYLPPGIYRITQTLSLTQLDGGCWIVGHGNSTILKWDGALDGTMLSLNGVPRALFEGIVFDGNNIAGIGLDHYSSNLFVTEDDHRYLAFKNMKTGIRFGNGGQASAEQSVQNCLFDNCNTGVYVQTFNNYDIVIAASNFYNCDEGIFIAPGANGYIRNCHFENSTVVDIHIDYPEHPCSVIRCTSVNSNTFINWSLGVTTAFIQNCHVSGWIGDAINIHWPFVTGRPSLIFDCVFTNPPNTNPPIIAFSTNPLVLSNNVSAGTNGVCSLTSGYTEIPAGNRNGVVTSAIQSFFKEVVCVPQTVFDVKAFGAVGDGIADDQAAIQAAIDTASQFGNGCIVYLPRGNYKVNAPLIISGANYTVGGVVPGGSAVGSRIFWGGTSGGITLKIIDPKNITIEQLAVDGASANDSLNILQSGTDPNSSISYNKVTVYGMYQSNSIKGLHFLNLPHSAKVTANHLNGNVRVTNSSRANILLNYHWEGVVTVEGASETIRDGFMGIQAKLFTSAAYGIVVKDNQNIVATSYYAEQTTGYFSAEGNGNNINGHVSIAGSKVHNTLNTSINIDNYKGRVAGVCLQYYQAGPREILQTGTQPVEMVWMANTSYDPAINFNVTPNANLSLIENLWGSTGPADTIPSGGLLAASAVLDDFREMGENDLALNFNDNCQMIITGLQNKFNYPANALQLYPNPATDNTIISYVLVENSSILISLHDILGKEIMQLVNEKQGIGKHLLNINTLQLQSGIYFVKMNVNGEKLTQKLVVNKTN